MSNVGAIHLWRYAENRRNFPGYHFTADGPGCVAVTRVLAEATTATGTYEATLSLLPVTESVLAVPNNRASAASSYAKWRLVCSTALPEKHLAITVNALCCDMQFSLAVANELLAGVQAVTHRRGDFSVGNGEPNCLWFWWYPSRRSSSSPSVKRVQ